IRRKTRPCACSRLSATTQWMSWRWPKGPLCGCLERRKTVLSTGRSGSMATWRKLVGGAVCGAILSASATSWAAYTGTPPLLVVDGGTGAATFTAHGVILGEGTAALGVTAVGTTGIPLIGQTGADPVFGTALVAGGGT